MRKLLMSSVVFLFSLLVAAHSGKARFHVIIDSDGAADDLRAICMLLANSEVQTLAITATESALTPEAAAIKIQALLNRFNHQGIPVGVGRKLDITPPMWRRQSEQIIWGDCENLQMPKLSAKELIIQEIESEENKILILCFGSLTNISDVIDARPDLKERIDRIIWYNSAASPLRGANYSADRASAYKVLESGIKIDIVSGSLGHEVAIDEIYLNNIEKIENNRYAEKIVETHRSNVLQPVVESGHLKMWDDLAVIYLFMPQLFTSQEINSSVSIHSLASAEMASFASMIAVNILEGNISAESRVFFSFPEDPALFAADVSPAVDRIISLHGRSEWRAGVLTNELHGHLGIYAIIGVKMGIRAREFFNIGVDNIQVVSYAGLRPPVSCINDGLQVSTGATLGHGLISISNDDNIRPEATFTFKNTTLRLKLKPEYVQLIREDIRQAISLYGNLTEPYWERVRYLAIKYWEEFDRNEIFEMNW